MFDEDTRRRKDGACTSSSRSAWLKFISFGIVLILLFIILGYSVADKHSVVLQKLHRETPMNMLLATAGSTGSTHNATCFPHLEFGSRQALGVMCLNPTSGLVNWHIEVFDGSFVPPLSHLAIHGPVEQHSSGAAFLDIDTHSFVHGEAIVVGMAPLSLRKIASVVQEPKKYYIEMRPGAPADGRPPAPPLRSDLN